MKYILTIGYRPTWPGTHQFFYPKTPEQERVNFFEKLDMLAQVY